MWEKLLGSWVGKNLIERLGSWKTTVGGIILGIVAYLNHAGGIDQETINTILAVLAGAGLFIKDGSSK